MRTIKSLTTALAMLIAFGALAAPGAFAHEWRKNGLVLTKAVEVEWKSTITLKNTKSNYVLECTMNHKGAVGPLAHSEITSITGELGEKKIPCRVVTPGGICSQSAEIEALHLPWASELTTIGGELRNQLTTSATEWKLYCKASGEKFTDFCGVSSTTAMHNFSHGVEEIYDSKSPETDCLTGIGLRTTGVEIPLTEVGILSVA
jgi:hypothetical protein